MKIYPTTRRINLTSNKLVKLSCLIALCILIVTILNFTYNLENILKTPVAFQRMELIHDIQQQLSNLPIELWHKNKNRNMKFNSTCARFPDLFNIHHSNAYWQTLETTNGTFQLFNAYLDVRNSNQMKPSVRILGMIDRFQPTVKTYCQIWFENTPKPVISRVVEYKYIWIAAWGNSKQGIYQPYLMSCNIPKEFWKEVPPFAISLVEEPCSLARTLLTVIYNKPEGEKKDFAVCVKGLNFPYEDNSLRMIEWIELLRILGADKIFIYELLLHPNLKKVLQYYEEKGIVDLTPLSLAGSQPSQPLLQYYYLIKKISSKRQNELIPYNDCFYKHMYEYKYIILLDTDEVIMPMKRNSWRELMDDVLEKVETNNNQGKIKRTYFSVRNVYFFEDLINDYGWSEDIPHYMYMLQHVYRSKNFTRPGFYVKSFFNTEKVIIVHNHWAMACFGNCYKYDVETEDAQMQHYRKDCVGELKNVCKFYKSNNMKDATIWKFKKPLVDKVRNTLTDLGYFNKVS